MARLDRARLVGRPLRLAGRAGRAPIVGWLVRRAGRAVMDVTVLDAVDLRGVRPMLEPPPLPPVPTEATGAQGTP